MELSSERVCYVQCNYCNTVLAVSVPYGSLFSSATVRCGHCANLLSVNMGLLLQSLQLQDFQLQMKQQSAAESEASAKDNMTNSNNLMRFGPLHNMSSTSSTTTTNTTTDYDHEQPAVRMPPIRPPEKRQRVPSAYNRFIKEEIQRIKVSNPEISHREAFSTAAKNWAHFPHIHFGHKLDASKETTGGGGGGGEVLPAHKSRG